MRTGGPELVVALCFDCSRSWRDVIARACSGRLSLHPKSPVPNTAALQKKLLRELLMVPSPDFLEQNAIGFDSKVIRVATNDLRLGCFEGAARRAAAQ